MVFKLLALFSTLSIISCSKELPTYSPSQMWSIAYKADPSIELVPIPEGQSDRRILCENYGPGCNVGSGKRIKIRTVELIVVQFNTEESAKNEAKRIGQYYARNWVFDDAKGEPVLEDFVKKVFQAKAP